MTIDEAKIMFSGVNDENRVKAAASLEKIGPNG